MPISLLRAITPPSPALPSKAAEYEPRAKAVILPELLKLIAPPLLPLRLKVWILNSPLSVKPTTALILTFPPPVLKSVGSLKLTSVLTVIEPVPSSLPMVTRLNPSAIALKSVAVISKTLAPVSVAPPITISWLALKDCRVRFLLLPLTEFAPPFRLISLPVRLMSP